MVVIFKVKGMNNKLLHQIQRKVVSSALRHEQGSNSQHNLVVIGTRYIKEIATL